MLYVWRLSQPLDEKRALASAPHEKQCERNGR